MCQALDSFRDTILNETKTMTFSPLWEHVSEATVFSWFPICMEQLGVTYLVTHHLMSRIPFAPCQAQLINIVLHLKKIYNQQTTYFLYVYGRIKP